MGVGGLGGKGSLVEWPEWSVDNAVLVHFLHDSVGLMGDSFRNASFVFLLRGDGQVEGLSGELEQRISLTTTVSSWCWSAE